MEDIASIRELYFLVAKESGGIARMPNEIDQNYVNEFCEKSIELGAAFVCQSQNQIIAEIHSYPFQLSVFSHVLSNLTMVVHPMYQQMGLGKSLMSHLLNHVTQNMPHIVRIELIARSSNKRAIAMYESLGFKKEGVFKNRILSNDGTLEDDIPMAWLRNDYFLNQEE